MSQSAVSQAVVRYRNTHPPLDKDEELDRALDLINELIATHAPRAKQGHLGATRMVDRLVNTKVKLAGLQAPTKVEVETHGQVEHAHVVVEPGRTLEELLSEWAAEGRVKVQGQLVRMDGGRDG
jgi:hypothetical protein